MKKKDVCMWRPTKDEERYLELIEMKWTGSCGITDFFYGRETPKGLGYKFCYNCGKPLRYRSARR